MRSMIALVLAFCVALTIAAKYKGGADLDPASDLRIGVKFKPEKCTVTSKNGDKLSMDYTGTLYKDGSQFDSSVGRAPFDFTVGQGQVIKGWDQGLLGMCVGEKRRLTIPSALGYGASGSGAKIPGGSTLVFEVELLGINGVKTQA